MNRPNRRNQYQAFTLVELLVVIGIIGVLVAILVPVISKVRKSSQTAATQHLLVQLGGAIENYKQDFGAYPGASPDSAWGGGSSPMISSLPNLTGSESLVLALLGGADVTFSGNSNTPNITYNPALLGNGPISFNRLNPGQKAAYLPYRKEQLSVGLCKLDPALSYIIADTQVPEFIDAYSDPEYRPILYLRANPGAAQGDANKIVADTYNAQVHYNLQQIHAYLKANDILFKGANDLSVKQYFSSSVTASARSAGSFLLISAGADHVFGNLDDIFQGGGGGQ